MVTFGGCATACVCDCKCVCVHILIHGSMTTTEIPLMTAHATTRTMTTTAAPTAPRAAGAEREQGTRRGAWPERDKCTCAAR